MFVINKSLPNSANSSNKLSESYSILNSVRQLKEGTKNLSESTPESDQDYSNKEIILIDDNGAKARININDLKDLDLDAIGIKLKMYFETKPENYDSTLVNLVSLLYETKVEQPGKTAYELAVENGFKGTELEWINSLKGDKGEKGDLLIGGSSHYPIGWQQILGLTDDVIVAGNEIWLKCNGQRVNKNIYPDLILTNAVTFKKLGDPLILPMTSNESPAPQVAKSSSNFHVKHQAYRAFDGIVSFENGCMLDDKYDQEGNLVTENGGWLQIDMGKTIYFNSFSLSMFRSGYYPIDFDLLISDDGVNFDLAKSFKEIKWTNETEIFKVDKMCQARFIRLVLKKVTGVLQGTIGEFNLYNTEEEYCVIDIPPINHQYTYVKAKVIKTNEDYITNPYLWEDNKEYTFVDGSYGKRFIGEIDVESKTKYIQKLDSITAKYIIDVGGEFYTGTKYVTIQSNSDEYYSSIIKNELNEVFFESYSTSPRIKSKYDIWIRYIKE